MHCPRLSSALSALSITAVTILGLSSCSTDPGDAGADQGDDPSLGVSAAALETSDVSQFEFTISECDGGIVEQEREDLLSMSLPGDIEALEGEPYDENSEHAFADHYALLEAGCYDVAIQPLQADGSDSNKCDAAVKEDIDVEDSTTTEVLLISQCEGPARGGLDVMGSVNHPPEIDDITFNPSKFVKCPETVEICMTATDPDGDPMRAPDPALTGPDPLTSPSVSTSQSDGTLEQCISFQPGQGSWEIAFSVFDQLHRGDQLIDVETYLKEEQNCGSQSDVRCESRDEMRIPLYGSECPVQDDVGVDVGAPGDTAPAADTEPDEDTTPEADTEPDEDTTPEADTEPDEDAGLDVGAPGDVAQPVCGDNQLDPGEECDGDGQAQCDAGETCVECQCEPEGVGCTRTQGYWKTHFDGASARGLDRDWPQPEDETNMLCGETWLDILNTEPSGGDMWLILAHQWIAAKLNVAAGASVPQPVQQALGEAETLLNQHCSGIPSGDRLDAEAAKDVLDAYNNGQLGPGKCEDDKTGCSPGGGQCDPSKFCDFPDLSCGQNEEGAGSCEARPTECEPTVDLVCGCDGQSYSSPCDARKAGTDVAHSGLCSGDLDGDNGVLNGGL